MTRPFSGINGRRDLLHHYDVAVIGSGIGGLICANILAKAGLKVLLIEQHYVVGGFSSTFRRKGYVFDAASHFYPLLGNTSNITGKLLNELGVQQQWIKMDPVDQFHLPDGSCFAVPADFDRYLEKLKNWFPEEEANIDRFFALVRKLYLLALQHYFNERDSKRAEKYVHLTVRDGLDAHFTSEKLKLLLTADVPHWGSPPKRVSLLFDSSLRLSYFDGNYYPVGGSQRFANELARRFEELGGHILMKSRVKKIEVKNDSVCSIAMETGPIRDRVIRQVRIGSVVSNADIRQTIFKMVGSRHFPKSYLERFDDLRPSYPCFLCHIGVRDISTDVLRRIHGYYWKEYDSDKVGTTAFRCKIFVPTLYEPSMAPVGGHVIVIQKVTEVDYASVQDWTAHKREIERSVLAWLEKLIPGVREKIVTCSSASAETSHRFTLNYQGAMLGWEMSPDQLGQNRPAPESPISGLFFAGQWTRPGGGITPVIFSAKRAAERILSGNVTAVGDSTAETTVSAFAGSH